MSKYNWRAFSAAFLKTPKSSGPAKSGLHRCLPKGKYLTNFSRPLRYLCFYIMYYAIFFSSLENFYYKTLIEIYQVISDIWFILSKIKIGPYLTVKLFFCTWNWIYHFFYLMSFYRIDIALISRCYKILLEFGSFVLFLNFMWIILIFVFL